MGQNTMGANNQMTQFAVVMFGSIVTSVALSTVLIMSLFGGPATGALTTQNNNEQSGVGVSMCLDPSVPASEGESAPAALAEAEGGASYHITSPVKLASRGYLVGGISGSFNTTNSNSTTTNTTTTTTYNTTTNKTFVSIHDNGNTNNQAWNNGNTNDSGNTNVQAWNNGNDNSNHQSTTTTNTSTTVNTTVQDNSTTSTNTQAWNNGNTNNENDNSVNDSGNTAVNVSDNGNTNNQNNNNDNSDNSNQNNDSSSNHHNESSDGGLF